MFYVFNMTKRKGLSMACGFGVLIAILIVLYFMGITLLNAETFMDAVIVFIIVLVIYTIAYSFFYYVIFRSVEN